MLFFFSSRRRHTRLTCDWSSDVCSSDLGSNGAIKQAVAIGLGVSLLSTHAAGPELASGALRRVPAPGAPLRRSWFLLRRADGPRPAAAQTFWDFCRSREARAAALRAVRPR